MVQSGIQGIDISNPIVMAGLFIGGMLPFVFSSMAMSAVGRAAMSMIEEVRRQFREIPELSAALDLMKLKKEKDWNDKDIKTFETAIDKAEYGKCVEISTQSAIKEMVWPGVLAISSPCFYWVFVWSRNSGRSFGWCYRLWSYDGYFSIKFWRSLGTMQKK